MFDWDKLRVFHIVADAGSFSKAADVMNMSQSAVSRQIGSLEEYLGLHLFYRHARGLNLTEQGDLLFSTTSDIFSRLSLLEGRLSDTKKQATGPLIISVPELIGTSWLAPKLSSLGQSHPGIQLTIRYENKPVNFPFGEEDASIRLKKPSQPDLIRRHITSFQFCIVASKDYLDRNGKPVAREDLRNHTLIGFPENCPPPFPNPNWLLQICGMSGKESNILYINSICGIAKAVEHGAGIACLPDYIAQNIKRLEILVPELKREAVDMYFVYHEERRNSKKIGIFRDFLLESAANENEHNS